MGLERPRRTASTPAMSVVATAPMPGIMIPNFPVAGLMLLAAFDAAPGVDISGRYPSMVLYFPSGGNFSIAYGEGWEQMSSSRRKSDTFRLISNIQMPD